MRKKILLVGALVALLGFSACDESTEDDGKIEVPFSSDEAVDGMLYTDAETKLSESGFTNINTVSIEDLVTGWLTSDGEIESISIDGDSEFSNGERFDPGVEVEIQYHTFHSDTDVDPESNSEEVTSGGETSEEPPAENITMDNNEEFNTLMSDTTDNIDLYMAFAEKYKDQTIEFDGHVDYLMHYKNYDTRWEALITSSDWVDEETVTPGPIFKIEDFNLQEINYDGGILDVGTNIHVVAKIIEYDEQAQLFFLDPITITQR